VSNKSSEGFDVTELQNGQSNTPISWSIIANRADEILPDGTISKYSEERFAAAIGPAKNIITENNKPKIENKTSVRDVDFQKER